MALSIYCIIFAVKHFPWSVEICHLLGTCQGSESHTCRHAFWWRWVLWSRASTFWWEDDALGSNPSRTGHITVRSTLSGCIHRILDCFQEYDVKYTVMCLSDQSVIWSFTMENALYKRTIQNDMYVSRDHTDWEPSFANLRRSFLFTSLATAGVWPPALSAIPACLPLWRAMRTYINSTSDPVAVRGLNHGCRYNGSQSQCSWFCCDLWLLRQPRYLVLEGWKLTLKQHRNFLSPSYGS